MSHLPPNSRPSGGFTLVELLTVMTIIGILAGLVLGTFAFAQEKGARSRAQAEISAMEAALESYKADNGEYPRGANSDGLNSTTTSNPSSSINSSRLLYQALSGDGTNALVTTGGTPSDGRVDPGSKQYMEFKPNQLITAGASAYYIIDPWGFSYGYSTINQRNLQTPIPPTPPAGFNPTFDLWSTGGQSANTTDAKAKWLKNW